MLWYNTITEGDKHLTNRAERQEENMSNAELKAIQAAIRNARDLIHTLNDGREMPDQLEKMFFELNDYSCILTGMIEED